MIQRIQSIYLALSALGLGSLFLFPFATSDKPISGFFSDSIYNVQDHPALIGLTVVGILLAVGAIFMYKNRGLQSKLTIFSIIMAIFVPVVAGLMVYKEAGGFNENINSINDGVGLYTPIAAIIFAYLALRGIQKDEKIVRSADRLR